MLRRLYGFLNDRSGAVAMIFGLAAIPIIAMMGAAVDYNRGAAARGQLAAALDGAALALARRGRLDDAAAMEFLEGFVSAQLAAVGYRGSWRITELRQDDDRVFAVADGELDTVMMGLLAINKLTVGVHTEVVREFKKVELALVLDNTGSMNSKNKIGALRDAATALVDILYENPASSENARVSLVPFVTAVNIKSPGAFQMSWMDTEARSKFHGVNFDDLVQFGGSGNGNGYGNGNGNGNNAACQNSNNNAANCQAGGSSSTIAPNHFRLFEAMNVAWKGCVEARAEPYDIDVTPPDASDPDTLFVPWFWPDEPNQANPNRFKSGSNGSATQHHYGNDYLDDVVTAQDAEARQRSILKYYSGNMSDIDETPSDTRGPNKSCGQPVVPLTNDANHLRSEISAMRGWNASGTNIAQGLVWGWNVLTPAEPFAQAVSYEETDTLKALVLLSDGENLVVGNSSNHNKSDYNAYNYLAMNRLGTTSQGEAAKEVNKKVEILCQRIKDKKIRVYTILFDVTKNDLRSLFRACASDPSMYFDNPSNSELKTVFQTIANDLANLRISR